MTFDPDNLERRCPRLGSSVTFSYCRRVGEQRQACWKIADCWWESFDVMRYLREHMSEAELQRLLQKRPKPKVASIVEMIEAARRRAAEDTDAE